jgi:nucleoside-diphosphate-sugar epimerase
MVERALITGGTGFIGQALARALRAHQVPVRVLVRPSSLGPKSRIIARLVELGVELTVGDVCEPASVRTAVAGASHVFHLAGQLQEPGVPPATYQAVHVDGTRHVLEAAAQQPQAPVVVHCSTAGVVGPTGSVPVTETAPLRPSTIYELTKARGERLARRLAARHTVPLVVIRPSLVYGPGDLHLLGWFRAVARGYYFVVGNGRNLVHPIHVDDVVTGLLRCADDQAAHGRTYQLVGQRVLEMRSMALAIADAVGRPLPPFYLPASVAQSIAALLEAAPGLSDKPLPLTRSRVSFMLEHRAYCGCQIARELRFVPAVELAQGLQQTVAWYRLQNLL